MSVSDVQPSDLEPTLSTAALRWRSRRGLLELELVLKPFVDDCLPLLDSETRRQYAALLEIDDCDLYDWIQQRSRPDDLGFVPLLERIREANRRPL
jgi:antitoxin CptB